MTTHHDEHAPQGESTQHAGNEAPQGPAVHDMSWDEVYGGDQVWSGNPNDALVATLDGALAGAPTGRALDVGCGEGADAIHLASRGWDVVALDVAGPALERGRRAAENAGEAIADRIEWVQAGLLDAGLAPQSFDLVSVFYPALARAEDDAVERSLRELVKPGGTLLMVAHAFVDRERALSHGFDPDLLVTGDDVVAQLGQGWQVEREITERNVTEGAGAHHHADVVIIARREPMPA